jgi:putative ABC transport system substrate-binding protein
VVFTGTAVNSLQGTRPAGADNAAKFFSSRAGGASQFAAIQAVAGSFGVVLSSVAVNDVGEVERSVAAFARTANGGLIVSRGALTITHRHLIVKLAAQHHLPAVYPLRLFVIAGGLISYGPDIVDQFRRAAARGPSGAGADQI